MAEVDDLSFETLVATYYQALFKFAWSLTKSEGDAADLTEGVTMAADAIDSGRAGRFLEDAWERPGGGGGGGMGFVANNASSVSSNR